MRIFYADTVLWILIFTFLSQDKSGEDDQEHNLPPSLLEPPSDLLYVHNLWVPNELLSPYHL